MRLGMWMAVACSVIGLATMAAPASADERATGGSRQAKPFKVPSMTQAEYGRYLKKRWSPEGIAAHAAKAPTAPGSEAAKKGPAKPPSMSPAEYAKRFMARRDAQARPATSSTQAGRPQAARAQASRMPVVQRRTPH